MRSAITILPQAVRASEDAAAVMKSPDEIARALQSEIDTYRRKIGTAGWDERQFLSKLTRLLEHLQKNPATLVSLKLELLPELYLGISQIHGGKKALRKYRLQGGETLLQHWATAARQNKKNIDIAYPLTIKRPK